MPDESSTATLFVRNLSSKIGDKALADAFEHFGPVRQAFILEEKGTKKHRGMGFVEFSLKEDANVAAKSMHDKELAGRAIKVDFAKGKGEKKDPTHKRDQQEPGAAAPPKGKIPKSEKNRAKEDKNTRGISSVAEPVPTTPGSAKQLAKRLARKDAKLRKAKRNEQAAAGGRAETEAGGATPEAQTIVEAPAAAPAVVELHKRPVVAATATEDVQRASKDGRLIVRNLPFQCVEADLRAIFGHFGPIEEIKLPTNEQGRGRGFGFVQYAETTVAQVVVATSGLSVRGRPVAVDFSMPAHTYKQLQTTYRPGSAAGAAGAASVQAEPASAIERTSDNDDSESEEEEEEESDESEAEEGEDEEDDDDDDGTTCSKSGDKNRPCDFQGATAPSKPAELVRRPMDAARRAKDLECAVFIRNILFETTEDTLRTAFARFGRVCSAKIVVDPHTGRPRGSGFINFSTAAEAAASIEAGSQGDKLHESRALEGSSIVSASVAQGGIEVDGRQLLVVSAVARDKAVELRSTEMSTKHHKAVDQRNLYLAAEGVIRPGDPAARAVSDAELGVRENAEQIKAKKLQDPNNMISPTRICLRNLPLTLNDSQLKQVCLAALSHGKQGKRIVQTKIVRDAASGRTAGGLARSKGYGFVEFKDHQDALAALRGLNNNPQGLTVLDKMRGEDVEAGGSVVGSIAVPEVGARPRSSRRLIVEFAIVSVKAYQKHQRLTNLPQAKTAAQKRQSDRAKGRKQADEGTYGFEVAAAGAEGGRETAATEGGKRKRKKKDERYAKKKEERLAKKRERQVAAVATTAAGQRPPERISKRENEERKFNRSADKLGMREKENVAARPRKRRRGKNMEQDRAEEGQLQGLIEAYKQKYL
jgi:nucleolar protein 4